MDSKMNQFAIFAALISILTLISFYINNNSISMQESFNLGNFQKKLNADLAAAQLAIKNANDKKAADEKAAADKKAADKKAADKKAADEKAAADKKAADEKAAADKKAADKKAADEKAAADAKTKAAADKKEAQRAATNAFDAVTQSVTVNDYYTNLQQAFTKNTIAEYSDITKAPKTNAYVILNDFYVNKFAPVLQKAQTSASPEQAAVAKKFTTLFNNGNPSPPIDLYKFLDNVDVINFLKLDVMKSTINDLLETLNATNNSSNASYTVALDAMIKIFTYAKNKIIVSESIDAISKSVTINEYYASMFTAFMRIFMSKYQEFSKAPKTDPYVMLLSYYKTTYSENGRKTQESASPETNAVIKKFFDLFNNGNPNPPVELYAFLDKVEMVNFINLDLLKTTINEVLSILNDLNDSSKSTYDADYKVPITTMIKIFTYMKGKIQNLTTTPMRKTATAYDPTTTPIQIVAPTVSVPGSVRSVAALSSTASVPVASVFPVASTVSVPGSVRGVAALSSTVSVPGASVFPAASTVSVPGSVRSLAALSSTVSVPRPVPMASVSTDQGPAGDLSTYNLIKSQNAQLSNMITNSSNENSKHYQKSVYQNGDINLLNTINNYLFIFYYLIILVLVYFIYIDKEYSIYKKVFVIALFAGYPYLANLIKYYVVKFFLYIYSFINIIVYETDGW